MTVKGFKAPPLSTKKLRAQAFIIRESVGNPSGHMDMISLIEFKLNEICPETELDIVEDHLLPNNYEAYFDPIENKLCIKESVYKQATSNLPNNMRHQFTLAHELGHAINHKNVRPTMNRASGTHKPYEDTEWQADTFAAELLMPFSETASIIKSTDFFSAITIIENKFKVSRTAAEVRIRKVLKELNQ